MRSKVKVNGHVYFKGIEGLVICVLSCTLIFLKVPGPPPYKIAKFPETVGVILSYPNGALKVGIVSRHPGGGVLPIRGVRGCAILEGEF